MTSARWFFPVISLFAWGFHASACNAPHYNIGRVWEDNASVIDIDIAIRIEDFAPKRLVCLAASLKEKYPQRNIRALIFSSPEAARDYRVGSQELPAKVVEARLKLHAVYSLNRGTSEEYIRMRPEESQYAPRFSTRIDLPAPATPYCTLAIHDRCLLEFRHIYYPTVEGRPEISGQVTLTGAILRNGTLSKIKVIEAEANRPDARPVLAEWAKSNFRSWRFERGNNEDAIRLTYRFEVVDAALKDEESVQFRLPSEVRVQISRRH